MSSRSKLSRFLSLDERIALEMDPNQKADLIVLRERLAASARLYDAVRREIEAAIGSPTDDATDGPQLGLGTPADRATAAADRTPPARLTVTPDGDTRDHDARLDLQRPDRFEPV